jgi:hypothetical protein
MLVSEERLPAEFDSWLDAIGSASDFEPPALPSEEQLGVVVASTEYRSRRPRAWERIGWQDSLLFKVFFTVTRFWKTRGDNLRKHWIGHRANHANFLAKHFTTELDGEQVPYSVTETSRVCSSCVEFFNVIESDTRKLVRPCPGSVNLAGLERDRYVDVRPVRSGEDLQ